MPKLSIFLAGLRPRPLGRKERPATSEATLLYRARIGEGIADPFPIFGFIPTGCFLIAMRTSWSSNFITSTQLGFVGLNS